MGITVRLVSRDVHPVRVGAKWPALGLIDRMNRNQGTKIPADWADSPAGFLAFHMVPKGGVEPPRVLPRWILSPVRLPVPPLRQHLHVTPVDLRCQGLSPSAVCTPVVQNISSEAG